MKLSTLSPPHPSGAQHRILVKKLSPIGSIAPWENIFIKMGRHPLPKASRTCWKAFVFYFMERLVGGISRSDSWGILVFLDFSVIWAPHHQGGGSTSSPNPVIFQKIKKCVILKTWKTKSGYCSKSNLEYARTLVLKGESRREQERGGERRREEERGGESRREKERERRRPSAKRLL